jgi:two-component system chemotaxis sensor kinase CheA
MSEQDELLREFLIESYENLDRLDGEFVALEEDPSSKETLSSIFRTIHTIKGTCGFLNLSRLESVTHAGENLLSSLREGEIALNDEITTALLHLVDAVREMLACIEETGEEGAEEYLDLMATLKRLQALSPAPVAAAATGDGAPGEAAPSTEPEIDAEEPEGGALPMGGVAEEGDLVALEEVTGVLPSDKDGGEDRKPKQSSLSASNIRVQVEQLDKLMNLAGELVLARNQILQAATSSHDAAATGVAQRLNLITTELQERIMKVRMQAVGTMWNKLPRVVRDLSKQLGKSVHLEMQGKGTELDKTLLEAIQDPITHLVRNAVDHGIETPEERLAAGKEEVGTLLLDAYHESGQVHIEIVDDGRGINAEAIKAKAVAQRVITSEQAEEMSDTQAYSLIFHPGLSTAKAVTNVSGRGVGMDVVLTNIEKVGGTVDVKSSLGRGTTVRIQIPLTLAIIPALIITASGDRYVIPQASLVELVRLEGESARTGIEDLLGSPVYRLRGELLPLLFLDEQLGIKKNRDEEEEDPSRNIVVLRAADRLFGLVVDDINDTEEIVVKPLDQQTKSVPVYAGTTILGDGQVSLILDIQGLARRSGVLAEDGSGHHLVDEDSGGVRPTTSYIMLRTGGRRMAVELSDVDRLEEFQVDEIEYSCGREVVQYRGEIMPLIRVSDALGVDPSADDESTEAGLVRVVVHCRNGQSVGLAVDCITDIIETSDAVKRPSNAPGIAESVVIDGRVTDLLDLDSLVGKVEGQEAEAKADEAQSAEHEAEVGVRQFCTFYLGDLFFGVDVMKVQEVLRHQPMTRVPLTTKVVSGLINLRGQTVTALDMRTRLGLPAQGSEGAESDPDAMPMNIVLRTGNEVVSILVDRIGDVLSVEEAARAAVPNTVKPEVGELLSEVYKLPDSLLLPLEIDRIVAVTAHAEAT